MTLPMIRQTGVFSAAAIVFAALSSAASADVLTGDEFIATHVGKCISYQGESNGVQCFHADGTMDYDDESYGKDTGTWSVSGDTICLEWSADPGVSCVPYNDDGDGNYSEGAYTWTIN
jgi:hypothetical protein